MISSDVIRGYNDTIILFLLLDGPSYGYEISKMIRELSEDKYIKRKSNGLYSAFSRLEKNGYIQSFYGNETQLGKHWDIYYQITEKGYACYGERSARNGNRLRTL